MHLPRFVKPAMLLLSGAVSALAFAPLHQFWLMPVSLIGLLLGWKTAGRPAQAAWAGLVWGIGYFVANIHWIYISLHTFGGMPAPLAALCIGLFALYLALFPAIAGWLTWKLPLGEGWHTRRALAAGALFLLAEWLRGTLFTGFPWASVGSSQIAVLGGFFPLIGMYGAGALLVMTCALALVQWRNALILASTLLISSQLLGRLSFTEPVGPPLKVSILQGNIQQDQKWNPDFYLDSLSTYLQAIRAAKGQLIIMPETAIPSFLPDIPAWYWQMLNQSARQADVLLGVALYGRDPSLYFNGVVNLRHPEKTPYVKQHLVPFGEYVPLPWLFGWMYRFMDMPLSGFTRGPDEQTPFAIAGGKVAANICYEDIFGDEIRLNARNATLLANFTNMAWFDGSWAAEQHAQMSQARALENGRWLIRATNTGKTVIIDPQGRETRALPERKTGILEGQVRHMQGETPYQRWGDLPVQIIEGLLLLALLALRTRRPA